MAARTSNGHEADFLQRLQQGDEFVFRSVFESYYATLCLFAERIIGDPVAAEDVVEDVFLKLWQSHQHFNSPDHLKGYLYQATRNASLNMLKLTERAGRRQHSYLTAQPDHDEGYFAELVRHEGFRLLYDAVQKLPEQARKIITLSYLEGLSNQEVADQLHISINTVKAQKRRGIALLRSRLPDDPYPLLLMYSLFFFESL